MSARHLELLVEELSMEAFLRELLPRILPVAIYIDPARDRSVSFTKFHNALAEATSCQQ